MSSHHGELAIQQLPFLHSPGARVAIVVGGDNGNTGQGEEIFVAGRFVNLGLELWEMAGHVLVDQCLGRGSEVGSKQRLFLKAGRSDLVGAWEQDRILMVAMVLVVVAAAAVVV